MKLEKNSPECAALALPPFYPAVLAGQGRTARVLARGFAVARSDDSAPVLRVKGIFRPS
jgi:hypothetical protein